MASLLILRSTIQALRKRKCKMNEMRMCRTCNDNEGTISIFNASLDYNLAEEISRFCYVTITQSDKFSKYICKSCLDLLNNCLLFRRICNKTNDFLNGTSAIIRTDDCSENYCTKRSYNWCCSYCPNKFLDLKSYYQHIPQCDQAREVSEHSSQVSTCESQKQDEHTLNDHQELSNHDADESHFEDVTNVAEEPISDDSYSVPSPTFSDVNGVNCDSCKRYFFDSESYNRHFRFSKICKRYSDRPKETKSKGTPKGLCEICGKSVSRPTLPSHMRLHQNVFPYACDSCPYKGRTKNLLIVHLRSHMSVKPYKCTVCLKTTSTMSNLSKHMESHCEKKKRAECPECGKSLRSAHSMKEHLANVHNNQTSRSECEICFKSFKPKHLKRHQLNVHKIDVPKSGRPSNRLPSYIKCMMEESFTKEQDELGPEMSLENFQMEYEQR